MRKFVPVTDTERALSEQTADGKEFAAHRQFDNPHAVSKGKVDRGWDQGEVGWGVVKSFGGDNKDSGAQIAKHAEGNHKMVRNDKGLWVKAKVLDESNDGEVKGEERIGGGRGKGGVSVVDKFLGEQLANNSTRSDSRKDSHMDEERYKDRNEDKDNKSKSREKGDDGRGRTKSRRDEEESSKKRDRRSESRDRNRDKDEKRRKRSPSASHSSRSRSRSRSPRHKKSSRRDRSDSYDDRHRRRSSSRDRRDRDRKRDRDSRDNSRAKGRDYDRKRDNSRDKERSNRHRRERDKSESRERGIRKNRTDSRDRSHRDHKDRNSDRDNKHVDQDTKKAMSREEHKAEVEEDVPLFITAIQVVNRFQEVFSNTKTSTVSRLRNIAEVFDDYAMIKSLKDIQKVYIQGKDAIVKSFEATTAAEVLVSKRIYVEHSDVKAFPKTFCLDLHRIKLAPGLGDPSKENALLYHCEGASIRGVWGMVDSAHLANDTELAEDVLYKSPVWSKACEVIATIWFGKADEESLKMVRCCAHYHNYDHMEVWG